ncbi:hypothetical protein [Euzebya rosea]|uniref:hypothetical protein n=1 Tax=Euzebya rosea TaxID=2052804 RepID=UPI000D3E9448|nr:hypothetical protein [Euzebya rosea]
MTAPRWLPQDRAAGASAPTTLLVLGLVTLGLTVAIASLGRATVALQHGTAAADAAALAVLTGSPLAGGSGSPNVEAAADVARDNGASLVRVELAGWPRSVVVAVAVDLDLPLVDGVVTTEAAAALHPP